APSAASPSAPKATPLARAATPGGTLSVGTRVRHDRFGEGTVVELTNQNDTAKARVAFDTAGEKNLLLRFARLEVIK
ncbi:MAG: hypothetical protein J6M53_01515, partial [Bacteroidaceae bacterium]|nr:hypothetical protein [Bacteroidaceae bacterium]